MFYLIFHILLNARQQNETIQWYIGVPRTFHEKIVIMLWDVMIID